MPPQPNQPNMEGEADRRSRPLSSLQEQLKRQIGYLSRSAEIFDRGNEDEAPRLAVSLRILLHDKGNSKSLLGQLGLKESISYLDTGIYRERLDAAMDVWVASTSPGSQIVAIQPGAAGLVAQGYDSQGAPSWVAPLNRPRFPLGHPAHGSMLTHQAFEPWWTTPLVEGSNLKRFSRDRLVRIMADQDGGAHVDPKLDADYADLCVDFLGVQWAEGDQVDNPAPSVFKNLTGNVAAASVRQIAYEVLKSLEGQV